MIENRDKLEINKNVLEKFDKMLEEDKDFWKNVDEKQQHLFEAHNNKDSNYFY